MAKITHVVKSGDTIWGLTTKYWSQISGSTRDEKMATLGKLNNLKDIDIIITGQTLIIANSDSAPASSAAATKAVQAVVNRLGLQSTDNTGRAMYADWDWERYKDHTKEYKYHWAELVNDRWVAKDGTISVPKDAPSDKLYEYCYITFTASENATKVRFQVLPVSDTYKVKEGSSEVDKPYWDDADNIKWSAEKEYDFSNNSPLVPPTPSVTIDDNILTASIDNIDAKKLSAVYVKFNLIKDNADSVDTSDPATIDTDSNYVSHRFTVAYGAQYKVRACTVNAKGKTSGWSEFSSSVGTRPSAPKGVTVRGNKRSDGSISAYLEWETVPNAEYYIVEYTTVREDFETAPGNIKRVQTEDARTSIEVTGIEPGYEYFFRLRAARKNDGESEPTEPISIPIGEPPAAPTTWSSATSAFSGESMNLMWTHNASDGSAQTWAQLSFKVNDGEWTTYTLENTTNSTSGERTDVADFGYGQSISYKGELYFKMDTTVAALQNAKIQWKVRTAGITDAFSDTAWSVDRTIYIYEKPTLALSVTNDLAGGSLIRTLDHFPFYIRGRVDLSSYELQRPIGYHLRVVANDFYETLDSDGRTKTINPGDSVYSKYFDTTEMLVVEMSAANLDLESGMRYTVYCSADMSSGLAVNQSYEFDVSWTENAYTLDAIVNVNRETFTASVSPRCTYADGRLVDNVTLSVYRREYNGDLIEIATGIPNNGTSVTDPHPALDLARYRLVARDTTTGALSFYDPVGYPVNGTSVVIQWDEKWRFFEAGAVSNVGGPDWSGSMLVLPYNVSISDNRKRDVSLVNYAGRPYPVSYYGTVIDETTSWSTTIPKDDVQTVYALRRLSLWSGNAYVREPSGMGFWANVVPKFNVNYDSMTIPVTLEITRVEGGV